MNHENPSPIMTEKEAEGLLTANNRDAVAMLAKADHRMLARDHRAASAYYGQVGKLAATGSVISADELARANSAAQWLAVRFREQILSSLDASGMTQNERHPRFQKSLEIMFGQRQREPEYVPYPQIPMTYFYPDTDYCEFSDRSSHAWASELEAQTDAIRKEALSMLETAGKFSAYVKADQSRPQGDVHGLMEDDRWSTFYLTEKGRELPERTRECAKTWAAMQRDVPLCDVPNRAPSVLYSLLRAGFRIPPHTGMLNTRLICHLPLVIPDNCRFRVGRQTREWVEGELMLFDDTVEHEAINDSAEDRIVLIFDVWRPEISEAERKQIRALFDAVDSY